MVGIKKGKSEDKTEGKEPEVKENVTQDAGSQPELTVEESKDGIRRMIKFGKGKGEEVKEEKKEESSEKVAETEEQAPPQKEEPKTETQTPTPPPEGGGESAVPAGDLEKQRAILQSIKDMDFQLKKNNEEIQNLKQQVETITRELDDLVSLYEIVSEQMNPFVGLSKVTKQRLEALEKFTTEVEELKNRLEDLELFVGKMPPQPSKEETAPQEKTKETPEPVTSMQIEGTSKPPMEQPLQPDVKNIPSPAQQSVESSTSDNELDGLIEAAFRDLSFEDEIDKIIEKFLEEVGS